MKWDRHMDCEVVKMQVFSSHFLKLIYSLIQSLGDSGTLSRLLKAGVSSSRQTLGIPSQVWNLLQNPCSKGAKKLDPSFNSCSFLLQFGRDMCYDPSACDLFVAGSSPEVWRLNLEQGRFLKPFETESHAINVSHSVTFS